MRSLPAAGLVAWLGARAWAGPGTTTAEFLRLDPSPRSAALGQASAASSGEASAMLQNPAALAGVQSLEMAASYNRPLEGVGHSYFGAALPWRFLRPGSSAVHAAGLSLVRLTVAPFPAYDGFGNAAGQTSASDWAAALGYAHRLSRWIPLPWRGSLDAGLALKQVRSTLDGTQASALAGDAGLLFLFERSRLFSRQSAGLSAQNVGGRMRFESVAERLPQVLRLAYQAAPAALPSLSWQVQLSRSPDSPWRPAAGVEYWILGQIALRAGYRSGVDLGNGFSFGMGVRLSRGGLLPGSLRMDYSVSGAGVFGVGHRVGLSYLLPPRRLPPSESERFSEEIDAAVSRRRLFEASERLGRFREAYPDHPALAHHQLAISGAMERMRAAGDPYGRAHAAYYASSWDEASASLAQALEREPDDEEIRRFEARARENAARDREEAKTRLMARAGTIFELAYQAYKDEDHPRALALTEEILSRGDYRPATELREGILALRSARPPLPAAAAPKPGAVDELYYKAMRLYAGGDTEGALKTLREALALDLGRKDVLSAVERIQRELGSVPEGRP